MSQPKKRTSRGRRDRRRYSLNNALDRTTSTLCPECNEPKRPHSICKCGFYKGKAVLPAPQEKTA